MPLILRGVSLLGVNCLQPPATLIDDCWAHLATDWRPDRLERIAPHEVTLEELPDAFERLLAGEIIGRTVVRIGGERV